jgi:hypothetical protein
MGCNAGLSNTNGQSNVCIGQNAGKNNASGRYNTILGNNAGSSYTGYGNVFIGYSAGSKETGGNKLYIANSATNPLIYGEFNEAQPCNQQFTIYGKTTINGPLNYGEDAQVTDDYEVTIAGIDFYNLGQVITFRAGTANTGACTVDINSLGPKDLKSNHDQDPADNYIEVGSMVMAVFDGTNFQMIQPDANP